MRRETNSRLSRRKGDVLRFKYTNPSIADVGFCPVGCAEHTLRRGVCLGLFFFVLHAAARQSGALLQCPYLSKRKKLLHRNDKLSTNGSKYSCCQAANNASSDPCVRLRKSPSCAIYNKLRLRRLTNQHAVGL